ncbi:MAG: hypothetical protein AAB403_03605 [Planctomycetota bacterium]
MADIIYPKGMRLWEPREGAPTYVKGSLTVHLDTFIEWAKEHQDEKGYIRLDLKEGREPEKALYLALNTYKKGDAPTPQPAEGPKDAIREEDVPF